MRVQAILLAVVLLMSGCLNLFGEDLGPDPYEELGWVAPEVTGEKADAWPNIKDTTLTVLDAGSFRGFDDAAKQFQDLTGVTVVREQGDHPFRVLEDIMDGKKDADVVMGLDQTVVHWAAENEILEPYAPLHASGRLTPGLDVFGDEDWYATPYAHAYWGYMWWNDDARLNHTSDAPFVRDIFSIRERAELVATPDPLAYGGGSTALWMTIGQFRDDPSFYDWQEFWRDVLVLPDLDGDGDRDGGRMHLHEEDVSLFGLSKGNMSKQGSKPIFWDRLTVPAWSVAGTVDENDDDPLEKLGYLLADRTTWHEVLMAGVVNETKNRAAAQAWIEFLLTDFVQEEIPMDDAIYPAVEGVDLEEAFEGRAPEPGTFRTAHIEPKVAGVKVGDWLDEMADLCKQYKC